MAVTVPTPLLRDAKSWRRAIHCKPELGFQERHTAERVSQVLRSCGITVHQGLGCTGVIGVLRKGTSSRTIALRADMDGLPITESPGREHGSQHPGVMHACGHDGHVAMLLGAASLLAASLEFDGTVVLVFQPAEEGLGGAREMLEDGLFERFPVDAIYGLHTMPGLEAGTIHTRPGPIMASGDHLKLTIHGSAGHAAMPHTAVDALGIAAELIIATQGLIGRRCDPLKSAVLSLTHIDVGPATFNVLPGEAILRGTLRCLDAEARTQLLDALKQLAMSICAAHGATFQFENDYRFPVLVNDTDATRYAVAAAEAALGAGRTCDHSSPRLASDDFAWFLEKVPGCYAFIGNGSPEEHGELHNPDFDFNDAILGDGITYWCELVAATLAP